MKTQIFTAFLILLIGVTALSQPRSEKFRSGEFGLEIAFPMRATHVGHRYFVLGGYQVYGTTFVWVDDPIRTSEMDILLPIKMGSKSSSSAENAAFIALYKKQWTDQLRKENIAVSEAPYNFNGSTGVQITSTYSDRTVIERMFFIRYRFVHITVATVGSNQELLLKTLNSLRLLTKPETIAALIEENEPSSVSQLRPALRIGNDSQEAGLKGIICSVTDEVIIPPETTRELKHEWFYDASGNLVREVSYNQGYPQEITQWGWIDGKRISSSRAIFFAPPEGVLLRTLTTLGPTTGLMGQERDDSPFATRHEFSYDDKGRITEQVAYNAEGKVTWRRKLLYTPTGRERQTLDATGEFLTRVFEVFDQDGVVSEQKILDLSGKPFSSTRFSYEFDQGGNWTVKRSYKGGTAVRTAKPMMTTFRTIKYCDARAA